jgi:hypothetical protein
VGERRGDTVMPNPKTLPAVQAKQGRNTTDEHSRRVKLLATWYTTPEEFRPSPNLSRLAADNAILPNHNWYKLANSDEVYQETMLIIAGRSLEGAGQVLEKLKNDALGDGRNSTRAAEVFLEYGRKVITDANFMKRVAPAVDSISGIMEKLDNCLDALNERANDHLKHKAVEAADWEEITDEQDSAVQEAFDREGRRGQDVGGDAEPPPEEDRTIGDEVSPAEDTR